MDNTLQLLPSARHRTRTKRKVRTCLMCGKNFRSAGPHNRRCYRCNNLLEHARAGSYYEPPVYSVEGGKAVGSFDIG